MILEGSVEPFLQFDFDVNVEPDKRHQIRQMPSIFCGRLHHLEKHNCNQCSPYLYHYRILGCAYECFDVQ